MSNETRIQGGLSRFIDPREGEQSRPGAIPGGLIKHIVNEKMDTMECCTHV